MRSLVRGIDCEGAARPERAGQPDAEVGFVHDQPRLRVVEEDAQLVGGVAVVDVERRGPELERGDQQLEVRAPVAEEQADAVTGSDA